MSRSKVLREMADYKKLNFPNEATTLLEIADFIEKQQATITETFCYLDRNFEAVAEATRTAMKLKGLYHECMEKNQ